MDLAGYPLVPGSFEYTTTAAVVTGFRVTSITPDANATGVSPSTPIEIKFSQPVAMDGLAPYLQVMNDGVLIPVPLTNEPDPGLLEYAMGPQPTVSTRPLSVSFWPPPSGSASRWATS